ncbi:MAG TPA: chromosome segregation protein SMC [Actinobacteria bacterium]|nr:chromosome segregation protein SMC [Actinomycetota bacterium]
MHLKSLTIKGFKSFMSSTTLRFEPGITCVVGPNGSGKSNVVDALAWVMGEQGAKSLRGGKMEDVIFHGSDGRAPLGRAEVQLTIDNTDGALPIEFTEVTISRTLFRNGGSEYAINGETCRLLDIQELLSDSGIGREMHVIVGQGQLDSIMLSSAIERRGFIEEAAGVLKHRKRKEKALRKLDSMEGNLTRVNDLVTELRRQLKPLGRQAQAARRAATIQADVRDAKLRLMADDLVQLQQLADAEAADESSLREQRAQLEERLQRALTREAELQQAAAQQAPRVTQTQETWFALSALQERLRSVVQLAQERIRLNAPEPTDDAESTRDPETFEAEAAAMRDQETAARAVVETDRARLAELVAAHEAAQGEVNAKQELVAQAERAAAQHRESLVHLAGQVDAARSRVETRQAEVDRLSHALLEATARGEQAKLAFTELETQVAGLDDSEVDLDALHARAAERLAAAEAQVDDLRQQEQSAERDRAALLARVEALRLSLDRGDGAASLLAAGQRVRGLIGPLADLIEVSSGYERAIAAALGAAADAVAVDSGDAAEAAIASLKSDDAGRAGIVVANDASSVARDSSPLPAGAQWAIASLSVGDRVRAALEGLLAGTVVVDDLPIARRVVRENSQLRAVTVDGDVVTAHLIVGGSQAVPSALEVRIAVDRAEHDLEEVQHRAERARFALTASLAERTDAQAEVEAALTRLHESDAKMAAVAERLGELGAQVRSAADEAARLQVSAEAAGAALEGDRATQQACETQLADAESTIDDSALRAALEARDAALAVARHAAEVELQARLQLRTDEERADAVTARIAELMQTAQSEREARARAAARAERRAREVAVAQAVAYGARIALDRLELSLSAASAARTTAEREREERELALNELRSETRDLSSRIDQLTDVVHRDEIARAEQRLRIEQVVERAQEEFGVAADFLVAEYGPDQLVPPTILPASDPEVPDGTGYDLQGEPLQTAAENAEALAVPYVRAEQEKRLKAAERDLNLLGRINPLALEEYDALQERLKFLSEQLEDLKRTKLDLLEIVRQVDERIEQVFTEAYEDVSREYAATFARLFPGGEGRLVLTDPADMLNSGVDMEARPSGKRFMMSSLLSGGERSLAAVAFVVALFKARPSPFYVMDEVEAALDDVNLQRLLGVMEELRANSQLIVITHQKRTMEIADALYGVSMRGDGVTTVISQRLREVGDEIPADAASQPVPA